MPALSHLHGLKRGALAWGADTRARIAVLGPDARPLLHRLSTQHVKELPAGAGRLNALLTDKGRFVDLVFHLDRGDEGVLLVGGAGRGAALLAWLDRYIFTEKVELLDKSASGSCAELAGAGAPALAEALVAGALALAPWAFVEQAGRLLVRGFDRVDAQGALVPSFVVVDLERGALLDALTAAGATRASQDDAEALRIAAGVPGEGGEIVEAMNPLDLALHEAIHWAKGCYIGQEVVARLDTYAKQGRRVLGVVLDEPALARVRVGDEVALGDKSVGSLTSVSPLWNGAMPSALAELRGPRPEGAVTLRCADGPVTGTLVERAAAQRPHD